MQSDRKITISINHLLKRVDRGRPVVDNPQKYDSAIRKHPFYKEMITVIVDKVHEYTNKRSRVLEIGIGTGTLTEELLKLNLSEYVGIEPDIRAFKLAKNRLSMYGGKIRLYNVDIQSYNLHDRFDLICSSFVDHHIPFEKKIKYYCKIQSLLNKNGIYVSGEELIGDFTNNQEYVDSLKEYHGWIIERCIQKASFNMAEIETIALRNGIDKFDEFKISLPKHLHNLKEANFKDICSTKLGPMQIDGGIYVITAQN